MREWLLLYRFRLRTILVVFTGIAACTGVNLAILQQVGFPIGGFDKKWMMLFALSSLPVNLVCIVGIAVTFELSGKHLLTGRLVLVALSVTLLWNMLSPLVDPMLASAITRFADPVWISVGQTLATSLIRAVCWWLMLVAFLRAALQDQSGN